MVRGGNYPALALAEARRHGRVSLERPIAERGEGMTWNELRAVLPGDCLKRHARDVGRWVPGLPRFPEIAREPFGPDRWRQAGAPGEVRGRLDSAGRPGWAGQQLKIV